MIEPSVLFQKEYLRLVTQTTVEPQAIALLQQAVYGTAGLRYQQTGQETKLYKLKEPLFFYLYHREELIGMYCLDHRFVKVLTNPSPSPDWIASGYYGRYLVVSSQHSGQGYGQLLKQMALEYVDQLHQRSTTAYLFYSYIEEKNTRSVAISKQAGFSTVSAMRTYFFRRYAPVKHPGFQQLAATEIDDMKLRLEAYYSGYTFQTFSQIGYQGNYFVIKENGVIVAGLQANPTRWFFKDMPGLKGWLLMNVLPRLKIGRLFFNPSPFDFIVLEGLYLRHDRAELLPALLESVLAHFGVHSAMWQLDEKDPHIGDIKQSKMGLLSGFEGEVKTNIMIKQVGLNVIPFDIQTDPYYVSCFDYA